MQPNAFIIIGIPGVGKTTLFSQLTDSSIHKYSLDIFDQETKLNHERISIMHDLFQKKYNIEIQLNNFIQNYCEYFCKCNSLSNTLYYFYQQYTKKDVTDDIKYSLRKEIYYPALLKIFLEQLENDGSDIIIDSGGLHFMAMNDFFFEKILDQFNFANIIFLYIDKDLDIVIRNLFQKNGDHFAFLERGFKNDIYNYFVQNFNIFLPINNMILSTQIIEKNLIVKKSLANFIFDILKISKEKLGKYLESVEKSKYYNKISIISLKDDNTAKNIRSIISNNMKNELIKNKPKAMFIDLSNTILNTKIVDLNGLNFVLTKYGLPEWQNGTRKKKDNRKSLRNNFPIFFGDDLADEAYQIYLRYLIDNIDKMELINGTIEMFEYCKKNEIKIIMISNRDKKFIDVFFEKFNIKQFFDLVISPDDEGLTKPDPKIILPACDKFNFNPNNDTLLFVGDALADMNCAFNSGCIPIMFTNIKRDEISEKSFQILRGENLENPIRIIEEYSELINLLEMSSKLWKCSIEVTKIVLIGGGGKIGRQVIVMLCEDIPLNTNVEIVLIGSGSNDSLLRLKGLVSDLKGSLKCGLKNWKNIKFVISNDYEKTKNADIVLCTAGKWLNSEEKEKMAKLDSCGRLYQSFINKNMIENIAQQIQKYSPSTLLVIVTNQVDMMCEVARSKAKKLNIIGLSGGVDSSRLKLIIKEDYGLDASGLMIGFHDSTMIPLISSIKVENKALFPFLSEEEDLSDDIMQEEFILYEKEKLDKITSKTRKLGGEISKLQRSGLPQHIDTGSSILPARALSNLVCAYCFDKKIVESYNTLIIDQNVADHYGVPINTALCIPLEISKFSIIQSTKISVLPSEKHRLLEAQANLKECMQMLNKCAL